eukprot:SAG22_NODE_1435_length_4424_cov_4.592695_1_plen_596_part_10
MGAGMPGASAHRALKSSDESWIRAECLGGMGESRCVRRIRVYVYMWPPAAGHQLQVQVGPARARPAGSCSGSRAARLRLRNMLALFLLPAAAAAAPACHPACAELQRRTVGTLTCDVSRYKFDLGNRVCEGILPLCVLRPLNATDVSAAVRLAREHGTPLSYRSGGHSYTCNGIKAGSIHLDLRSLSSVHLVQPPPHSESAGLELSFGSGLVMRQLLDALPPNQTIVHGQCPTVGAGGLFLHGGLHTTLTLDYGRGNDTVTSMQVVTADGDILELSDSSPPHHQDLWTAMRQSGSSFAIATRISAKVIEGLPAERPTDGGDFFGLDMPRAELLARLETAADARPGLPNFIHVNGIDFLAVSADKDFDKNAAWLESWLGRKLSARERLRSSVIAKLQQPLSDTTGADPRFGASGEIPYVYSTQEAFATVAFIMPIGCFRLPAMKVLLATVPEHRDNTTDLGCYLQVTTTYTRGTAFVDYNCPYDSPFYRQQQRELNDAVLRLCPAGMLRYVNTPSSFLTARDYYPNYDMLAEIKQRWDPDEIFRVYQGIRPTGLRPDANDFRQPYTRTRSVKDKVGEAGWDELRKMFGGATSGQTI